MSTGHIVSHAGSRFSQRTCRHGACDQPAVGTRNGCFYCAAHLSANWSEVTAEHVRVARQMMVNGGGLAEIAVFLDVSRSDLDRALWQRIAEPCGRRPRGDF